LGVAVLGSIFTSLYAQHLSTTSFHTLPTQVVSAARNSVAAALTTVGSAPDGQAQQQLLDGVQTSFMSGFHAACIVAAGICLLGAFGALLLPGRARRPAAEPTVLEPATVAA
jgi:hypothetical protein